MSGRRRAIRHFGAVLASTRRRNPPNRGRVSPWRQKQFHSNLEENSRHEPLVLISGGATAAGPPGHRGGNRRLDPLDGALRSTAGPGGGALRSGWSPAGGARGRRGEPRPPRREPGEVPRRDRREAAPPRRPRALRPGPPLRVRRLQEPEAAPRPPLDAGDLGAHLRDLQALPPQPGEVPL